MGCMMLPHRLSKQRGRGEFLMRWPARLTWHGLPSGYSPSPVLVVLFRLRFPTGYSWGGLSLRW